MALQQLAGQSQAFFSASSYLASSATSKMNSLWSEVTADSNPGEFPSKLGLAGIFVESMEPTFSTKGDAMEAGYFGSHRTKYIHSVGAHGKVVLNSTGAHPFTGLFQGANHGIVRLSSAAKPELGTSAPLGPGMGLKFLRDGIDSANLVAMYGVNGQPGEWNFFAHEFQNHIKPAEGAALQAVAYKFSSATDWIQEVGLSDWAKFGQNGQENSSPVFPWRIDFAPNPTVASQFSNSQPSNAMNYLDQLKSVPANSVLYTVYGWTAPPQIGGKKVEIGSLQLQGNLVTSKWGDEKMFFRHQKMDADLRYQPGWKPYYASYKLNGKCPYEKMLQELNLY